MCDPLDLTDKFFQAVTAGSLQVAHGRKVFFFVERPAELLRHLRRCGCEDHIRQLRWRWGLDPIRLGRPVTGLSATRAGRVREGFATARWAFDLLHDTALAPERSRCHCT